MRVRIKGIEEILVFFYVVRCQLKKLFLWFRIGSKSGGKVVIMR